MRQRAEFVVDERNQTVHGGVVTFGRLPQKGGDVSMCSAGNLRLLDVSMSSARVVWWFMHGSKTVPDCRRRCR